MTEAGDQPRSGRARLAPGAMLGRLYRVVRHVGQGAQGHVYEVEHVRLGTRFAAKLLHSHLGQDPSSIKRFEREASMASQLAHPCIARVVNFDQTDDGHHFAIMELLEGEDLGERLRRGALSVGEACAVTADVAAALSVAHDAGVVHRDLKPSNLFLTRGDTPTVKLTDFGISKMIEPPDDATQLTDTGAVVGTPMYMAPEQAAGEAVDHRVDVYALGIVLFEMLAAQPPFRSRRSHQLIVEKTFMESPDPAALLPGMPVQLAHVLRKAIAKRPQDRFQSMRELVAALHEATTLDRTDPDLVLTVKDLPPLSDQDYERATLRGHRAGAPIFAVVGAIAGVGMAVGIYLIARSPEITAAPEAPPTIAVVDAAAPAAPAVPQAILTSDPVGAEVLDPAGRVVGRTPLTIELPELGTWQVRQGSRRTDVRLDPAEHDGQTVRVVLPAAPRPPARRPRRPRKPKGDPQPLDVDID